MRNDIGFFKSPRDYYQPMMDYYPGMTKKQVRILIYMVDMLIVIACRVGIITRLGTTRKESDIVLPGSRYRHYYISGKRYYSYYVNENLDNTRLDQIYQHVKGNKK